MGSGRAERLAKGDVTTPLGKKNCSREKRRCTGRKGFHQESREDGQEKKKGPGPS